MSLRSSSGSAATRSNSTKCPKSNTKDDSHTFKLVMVCAFHFYVILDVLLYKSSKVLIGRKVMEYFLFT